MPNKSIEDTYKKKTQLEHIIDIPDTYIGSIEKSENDMWIYDDNNIVKKTIEYTPGLFKIFDEIIVNAIDHWVRLKNQNDSDKVKNIKVNIINNEISVYNDGDGIPVVVHKEHNVYIPELLIGHLLTSANYDKDEKKITGGKNGFGSKLTNIFSTKFTIETVDSKNELKYIQTFENNMSIRHEPIITKCKNSSYTKITFEPDLKKFNLDYINEDTIKLMTKRVYDITACTGDEVKVFFNDKKIICNSLEKYVNYYLDQKVERVYEYASDRWEVVVAINNDSVFDHVSFVNGINTFKGGKHVDAVINSICKKIQNIVSTKGYKRKKMQIKQNDIKENIFLFVRSTIENPSFDSQIKEYLTTPSTKFGSKIELSDKFIEKLMKTSLIDRAIKLSEFKENITVSKETAKKTNVIKGIEKLDDANNAGTKESLKCTLILTEGDSAKALAVSGLSVVGRDYFGIFPLKGKLLNVRDITYKKASDNKEITNLMKIMGLGFPNGKKVNIEKLRYGRIMIFTDQDVDGSHIKGLIMNLFNCYWPELLEIPGFIISLATPIIKAKNKNSQISFYTLTEYEKWLSEKDNTKWEIKYYKGLGTSTSSEAKEYFTDFENKKINYIIGNEDINNINVEDINSNKTDNINENNKEKEDNCVDDDDDNDDDDDEDNFNNDNDNYNDDDEDEDDNDSKDEDDKKIKKLEQKLKITKKKIIKENNNYSDNVFKLAFDKSYSNDRKEWLKNFDKNITLSQSEKEIRYIDFINKDLIHFSNYDNERSLPHMCDGLKPSHRKILYSVIKKNQKKPIKVSQLAGYVSENSAYHHGENSLLECIIGMAQNFVGSNNIELLYPDGQFGTRLQGGKDAASPRYIWTYMTELASIIYNYNDNDILKYNYDDNNKVEPIYYIPIIPMILVNGTEGIGTGFSTKIPPYNPLDIVDNIYNLMDGKELKEMTPWFRGFKGEIKFKDINESGNHIYINKGVWKKINDTTINITELPIGKWTDDYKSYLESLIFDKTSDQKSKDKQCIVSFINNSSESHIDFEIKFKKEDLQKLIKNDELETRFKLTDTKNTSLTNIHLYNTNNKIAKYDSPEEILKEFYLIRMVYYLKRKENILSKIKKDLDIYKAKVVFINDFINNDIKIINIEDEEIIKQMEDKNYPKFGKDDENLDYDYLLTMQIKSLTKRKIEELNKLHDNKLAEYNSLSSKDEKTLWKEDLEKFKLCYNKMMKEYDEINESNINKPKSSEIKKKSKK